MTQAPIPLPRRQAHDLWQHVAAEINAEIGRRRLTRAALANAVGITGPTLSKRLNGQQPMTLDFIEQVCRILDIEASQLFGWSPPDAPVPSGASPRLDSNQRPPDYKACARTLTLVAA